MFALFSWKYENKIRGNYRLSFSTIANVSTSGSSGDEKRFDQYQSSLHSIGKPSK